MSRREHSREDAGKHELEDRTVASVYSMSVLLTFVGNCLKRKKTPYPLRKYKWLQISL
jgi:hypothetical protein